MNTHKIENIGCTVYVDGKPITTFPKEYETKACADQLKMLDAETLETILAEIPKKGGYN